MESLFAALGEYGIETSIEGCCNNCVSKALEEQGAEKYAFVDSQDWDLFAEEPDGEVDLYIGFSCEEVAEAILEVCSGESEEWMGQGCVTAEWSGDTTIRVRLVFSDFDMAESTPDDFYSTWKRLAEAGEVGELGGQTYRYVAWAWVEAGRVGERKPGEVEAFIRKTLENPDEPAHTFDAKKAAADLEKAAAARDESPYRMVCSAMSGAIDRRLRSV